MKTINMKIKGMGCGGCELAVQNSVSKISGVVKVKASCINGNALVEYDGNQPEETALKAAVEKAGYIFEGFIK